MKTLSIQQPWASLICAGIKDVENRTWKAAENPGRILIHASSKKVTKSFFNTLPLEWFISIQQDLAFGNIPTLEKLPTSAIIGYVTVKEFADQTDSPWDGGDGAIKWVLEDAYLFDEPILNVEGKLHLFDYPLDEDNLPAAHKVELKYPTLKNGLLTIPCNKALFESISEGSEYSIDLDGTLAITLTDEDGALKPIDKLCFQCDGLELMADAADPGIFDRTDPNTNEPIVEKDIFGEDLYWQFFSVIANNISR